MRDLSKEFENRNIDYERLIRYGFQKKNNTYSLKKFMQEQCFQAIVEISDEKQVAKLMDLSTNEEFVLVDVRDSSGDFVGKIREEYEEILEDIFENCSTFDVFQSKQAKEVIQYVKEKYQDDLEYLWKKFPKNAIFRNKKNHKWYAALLVIPEKKLGIDSDKMIEIIDVRYQQEDIQNKIDNQKIWGGYHMNKEHWITIKLDETIDIKEIFQLIDNSYQLSLSR